MVNFSVITPGQTRKRMDRRPNFPIAGTLKPFGLYPLMCHPVLPGETIENFNSKIRVLSKPIKHPLAGAWLETWLVYVKFTDLDRSLGEMFISDNVATIGYTASADNERYFVKAGQIDWLRLCTERFHEAYFRDQDEPLRKIDGVPKVKLNAVSWYQNMIFKPTEHDAALPTQTGEVMEHLTGYQMMQQMSMSELSYEKYLEQFGVSSIATNLGDPEILRYTRSWTVPNNTVEPSTGLPSSAWIWSDEIKMDKAKRFSEPGFVLHFASVRPKMFQANLGASMVGNLWGFSDWFPVYNLEDPSGGIKDLKGDDAVFDGAGGTSAEDLIYDHRDLLSHGEQFINNTHNPYDLPLSTGLNVAASNDYPDLRGHYANSVDIDALFLGDSGDEKKLFYEGISSARIRGHIKDTTL